MTDESAKDITHLLNAAAEGDFEAAEHLSEVVYNELRRLAHAILKHNQPDQTLRTTALVNEAWLRLAGGHKASYKDSRHFYRTASKAMRSILIDYARTRKAKKRGGSWQRTPLDNFVDAVEFDQIDLVALDDALAKLEAINPRRCQVVELRFFAGLSIEQTARALDVSHGTVESDWHFARIWLHRAIEGDR